jgi:uncharacterized membrane protein YhhN
LFGVLSMIWWVICLGACASLVFAEYRALPKLRTGSKVIASAAFIMLAVPAVGGGPYQSWIFVGLVLGALGDMALLGRGSRAFLGGLAAFLAGHLAYVIALAQIESPAYWIVFGGRIGLVAIFGGVVALTWLWHHLGPLKVPVIVYVIAIVAMVVGAFAVQSTGGLPAPERDYLAIGAALFFLSDLAVARDRFIARDFKNKLFGLPAYYLAQLLIASSL